MTVAIDLINHALEQLGAHSPVNPAPSETINRALGVLTNILVEWNKEDFNIGGTIPADTTTEINELDGSTTALEGELMLRMAPIVRRPVPAEARQVAVNAISKAKELFQYVVPDRRRIPVIPGQGNPFERERESA